MYNHRVTNEESIPTTTNSQTPPPAVWRWLGLAAVLLMVGSVLTIALISAGVFDPQPVGQPAGRWQLQRTVELAPGSREIIWLDEPQLPPAFTLRLRASLVEGNPDAGYGLAIGAPEQFLAVAVSPTGYVSVWRETAAAESEELIPWQTWPHVATANGSNEIQLDVVGAEVTVRINRELLWQGEIDVGGTDVALYGESFAAASTIRYQELQLFAPGVDR